MPPRSLTRPNSRRGGKKSRNIVFLVYRDSSIFTLAGFIEAMIVLENDEIYYGTAPYKVSIVSVDGSLVESYLGLSVASISIDEFATEKIDTLVICSGYGYRDAMRDRRLLDWIAMAAKRSKRTIVVATGAYLAAEAGILDGKQVVTHWFVQDAFQLRYPQIQVQKNVLFFKDGALWSSAGMTSTLDVILDVIEADLGREASAKVAQRLLVFIRRSGKDPQRSPMLEIQLVDRQIEQLHSWIASNLGKDLTVSELADQVGMSVRNFSRVYKMKTRMTPHKAIEMFKIEMARRGLRETEERVSKIAWQCGFGDESNFRRAFRRWEKIGPQEYREMARAGKDAD
ncbi:MAG: hypothetical protein BGP06_17405 [Rhizobiales bacterium 65-9]|nr:helix-turn-helix domain-containing protein [Hyphomicrobiales bacterium]OJY40217.1 MAG: hypothetical protein BGP06_17405 [Rhizobiales bacterium 65-9]